MHKNKLYVIIIVVAIMIIGGVFLFLNQNTPQTNNEKNVGNTIDVPTVKVGYLPLIDHMSLMVAAGSQMFDGQQINVEPVKFSDWPSLVEAVKSGNIDGVHIINNLAEKMVLDGLDAKTVVLSHREAIDFAVADDITEVSQLRGKTIAVPSRFSTHYVMLVNFMSKNGMTVDKDYQVLDVAPPDFVSTLASGKVSGFVGSEPFPTIAEAKKVGTIFKTAKDMMIDNSNGLDCVVVFRQDFINKNHEAIQAYVDGIVKAGEFITNHPMEASKIASPYLLNQKPELIAQTLTRSRFDDLMPRIKEYEAIQNYTVKIGLLPKKIDLDNFIDSSYAEKAYASLGINIKK